MLRRLGVPDRLHRVPVLREPPGGGPVQPGDLARRGAPQLQPQQRGEHLVVAEPGPCRVQRDRERVRGLQVLQHLLGALVPGQQGSQLPVHPLQDGGAQQQPPHRLALPVQHLSQQVLRHRPLAAGELRREPLRIRVPGRCQRGQPESRRPPLGPLMQHRQRRPGQLHPCRREQLPRLGQGELQVPGADLGQVPFQPQPVQPQPDVMPGRQHEPQPRRRSHHQQLQLPQRVRAQLVHVIDHQPQGLFQRRQVIQQPFNQRPPAEVRCRRHRPYQPGPGARLAQRLKHRLPEPLRVTLLPPRRYPRRPPRRPSPGDPRPQQYRLAAAGRRRHYRHPRRPPEPRKQCRPGNQCVRTTADLEVRALRCLGLHQVAGVGDVLDDGRGDPAPDVPLHERLA